MRVIAIRAGARELFAEVEIGDDQTVQVGDLLPHFERRRYRVTRIEGGITVGRSITIACAVERVEGAGFSVREERARARRASS